MPPICESSKHSKFSLISVISPIGSDFIGNSSSTLGSVTVGGGCGVAAGGNAVNAVADACEIAGVAEGRDVANGEDSVGCSDGVDGGYKFVQLVAVDGVCCDGMAGVAVGWW